MPPTERKRLFLVDGMSQIYRAYYALPALSNSKGLPTNAVYGFIMMLRKLITSEKPDYLGVALDSSEPTFRHEAYEQYKATRQPMPDDLSLQLPYIQRTLKALRVPITRHPKYEADDIIGTFAREAEQSGLDVLIVTNDKDLSQLVNDHVKILRTERTGEMRLIDAKVVEEKMGVRPDQVVELLGLWGDTIDNIPGAPGIGEKGARQIIQQYGTIEEAIAHASEIPRKNYRESLQNNVELIRRSRELVTIDCDVPVQLDLNSLVYEEPDRAAAYELFSELEFAQLKREFVDAAEPSTQASTTERVQRAASYRVISSRKELDQMIESIIAAGRFAFAIAERKDSVFGIAFSWKSLNASLVDFERFEPKGEALKLLKGVLENPKLRKVVYDWKRALTLLDNYAHERRQDTEAPLFRLGGEQADGGIQEFKSEVRIAGVEDDMLLACYLLDPNRATFKIPDMTREHLEIEWQEIAGALDRDASAALQSADFTLQMAPVLREKIKKADLQSVYREIELPLVELLFQMERIGVRIDTAALQKAAVEIENELSRLTHSIYELAGEEFNINSPAQLGDVFEKLNFEVGRKTKTGKISTSFDVLEELAAKYEL